MTQIRRSGAGPFLTKEELVARHVREGVLSGRFAPGQRLLQNKLAEELGVSPTPVREALRGLVNEGWLISESHVGVSVAEINDEGVDEVYRLRMLLEGELAAEAARRMTPATMQDINDIHAVYRQATKDGDVAAVREANLQFHAAVWQAASSPVTVGVLNSLWARVPRPAMNLVRDRIEKTLDEHEAVVAALAAGDEEAARAALAHHIRSGQQDYRRSVRPSE